MGALQVSNYAVTRFAEVVDSNNVLRPDGRPDDR